MEQYTPNLGENPGDNARRDAVHVAVAPVVAGAPLDPGDHVWLNRQGEAVKADGRRSRNTIGVVDPFRDGIVLKGGRFWLFLYQNTVTSLRHSWTHPAFTVRVPETVQRLSDTSPEREPAHQPFRGEI